LAGFDAVVIGAGPAGYLAAGYLSHLMLDFVTYEGVPWFWPLDEKYSLDLRPAGGLFVNSLGFLALVLSVYLLPDPLSL
jgi:membrane-bound metal-dependent hydrolase YbcI (DUF457 family)